MAGGIPCLRVRASMKSGRPMFGFALTAVAHLLPVVAEACAVCGTGPGIPGDPTTRGFYWGILFLMAMPFAVAGSIGAWLAYRHWRARVGRWRKVPGVPFAWMHKER